MQTPALESGLLAGITRRLVLELAAAEGLICSEGRVTPEDLAAAREAFLTASTIEILPIAKVEGRPLGDPVPGALTRLLQRRYRERVREYCRQAPA